MDQEMPLPQVGIWIMTMPILEKYTDLDMQVGDFGLAAHAKEYEAQYGGIGTMGYVRHTQGSQVLLCVHCFTDFVPLCCRQHR